MNYIVTFPLTTDRFSERIARFLESGAPPPDGVTLHGRWFTLGHDVGFMHVESDEPKAIYGWIAEWADIIDFEVHPVISDQEAAEVLQQM